MFIGLQGSVVSRTSRRHFRYLKMLILGQWVIAVG